MSDGSENPYESPQAEINTVNPLSGRVLTEDMVYYLKGASPWLRFIGIAGFICFGVMVLGCLAMIIGLQTFLSSEIPGFEVFSSSVVLLYTLMFGLLIFFPSLFIFRTGRKIQKYLFTGSNGDLEAAFKNNKSLWTFVGVLTIIGLVFFSIGVFAALIAALIGAFAG